MKINILVIIFSLLLIDDARSICGCNEDSLSMKLNTGDSINVNIEESYSEYGEVVNRYSSIDIFDNFKSLKGRLKFTNGNLSSFSKIVKCKGENIESVTTLNNDTVIKNLISKKRDKEGFMKILTLKCKEDYLFDTILKFPMKKTRTFETESGNTTEIIFYGIIRGKEIVTKRVVSKYDQNNLLNFERNESYKNIINALKGVGKIKSHEFTVKTTLVKTDTTIVKRNLYYLDDLLVKTRNQITKLDSLGRKKNVKLLITHQNNEIDGLRSNIKEYSYDQNYKSKLIITERSLNHKTKSRKTLFSIKIRNNGLTTKQIIVYLKKFNLII